MSPFAHAPPRPAAAILASVIVLQGCALQPPYVDPATVEGRRLSSVSEAVVSTLPAETPWWIAMGDPAVNTLVAASLQDNPTLVAAIAAIDEARAGARRARAAQRPTATASGSVSRLWDEGEPMAGDGRSTANTSLDLSWEVDLFGRLSNTRQAAEVRLDARINDARATRLALTADVAANIVSLRACDQSIRFLEADIAAQDIILALTEERWEAGFDAFVDVAAARAALASSQTALALRGEACAHLINRIVALTGLSRRSVIDILSPPIDIASPDAPDAIPLALIRANPAVMAAEAEVEAAWLEIAAARAERYPRFDLTGALTGRWVRTGGGTAGTGARSISAAFRLPLLDGGAGEAGVSAAQARYAAALADLDLALRSAVTEVENALASAASARNRRVSSRAAAEAAAVTLSAREAQWRAGAVDRLALEDARRQRAVAEDSRIAAERDVALAWIALVRAAGAAPASHESHAR